MEIHGIDPEKCSLEELEAAIKDCENKRDYYNSLQLGAKVFINSVYGVFGTDFFNLSNKNIAESITLQGQDLIKYSVNKINDYFANQWMGDIETHDKIVKFMKEKFPDFDEKKFKELVENNKLQFDTMQVYGDTDSVSRDSIIKTEKHPDGITIEDWYNENYKNKGESTVAGHESVNTTDCALNVTDSVKYTPVKRIIRHKVNKPKYRLKTASGKIVECTGDHSLVIVRNGERIIVKPSEIVKGDKVISLPNENNFTDN